MKIPLVALTLVLASGFAACSDDTGSDSETDSAAESNASANPDRPSQDSSTKSGYRTEPPPDVSGVGLVDFAPNSARDPAGSPFVPRAEPGKLVILFFGYLSCPDVCPLTIADIRRATAGLSPAEREKVSVAMVTIDPDRDTGDEMAGYLAKFFSGEVEVKFHALRGADQAALDSAGATFGASWTREEETESGTYFMSHSASIYVVDSTAHIIWTFPFGTEPEDMAAALASLVAESA